MERRPTIHRMTRRSAAHDYSRPGLYHITMHVAEALGHPLGTVTGSLDAPDGSADAPHTALTSIGQMVEHELLTAVHQHYPMATIQDYVIMPEHLHFLLVVSDLIVSKNGTVRTVGDIIAGFKKGCNKHYWEITGNSAGKTAAHTVPSGSPAGQKVPSSGTTGRQPLFAPGYCDVMPIDAAQLQQQRAYIKGNPRSRLMRTTNREWLQPRRGGIDTALTPSALRGYLQRECAPSQFSAEAFAQIEGHLLLERHSGGTAGNTACGRTNGGTAGNTANQKALIGCDSYGDRRLLERRLLPVVCHRKDAAMLPQQQARCLEEAERGTVLVSPRIAKGEQAIIDDAVQHGFAVVLIADNGFPEVYHPSTERIGQCAAGQLLIVTPWQYHYRGKDENITVLECKTMNCLAQALCRTRDDWWKSYNNSDVILHR